MTHTPGPWYCDEPHSGDADRAVYALTPAHKNRHYMARVYGGGALAKRNPEMDANASLIAAAPDMLAALEQVLEFHAKCEREDAIDWQWFDAAYYAARAAIAKARGETKGE